MFDSSNYSGVSLGQSLCLSVTIVMFVKKNHILVFALVSQSVTILLNQRKGKLPCHCTVENQALKIWNIYFIFLNFKF